MHIHRGIQGVIFKSKKIKLGDIHLIVYLTDLDWQEVEWHADLKLFRHIVRIKLKLWYSLQVASSNFMKSFNQLIFNCSFMLNDHAMLLPMLYIWH